MKPLLVTNAPVRLSTAGVVGDYRIIAKLGQGGMGEVYLGEHLSIGRRVALKVLHARLLGDARAYERFVREARLANLVRHPGVMQVTELGHLPDGRPWLAMEHVEGASLHSLWDAPFSVERFFEVVAQILDALEAIHQAGVVHRDLKPSNIYLTREGRIKLLDFGTARCAAAHDDRVTETGEVVATARYMSPEQATGEPTDVRSDLYSLGLVMWELIVGHMPFVGRSFGEWVLVHATVDPAPPSLAQPLKVQGRLPARLDAVILRCLAKRADQRFKSIAELRRALARAGTQGSGRRTLAIAGAALVSATVTIAVATHNLRAPHGPSVMGAPRSRGALLRPDASPVGPALPHAAVPSSAVRAIALPPVVLRSAVHKQTPREHRLLDSRLLKNPFGDAE
jgi:serine/threonine-protein kinase